MYAEKITPTPVSTTSVSHLRGLTSDEGQLRRVRHGSNALPEHPPEPLWRRILRQFASPLIYILFFALAINLALRAWRLATGCPRTAA